MITFVGSIEASIKEVTLDDVRFSAEDIRDCIGNYKVGTEYSSRGITYNPLETYEWEEYGLASWYGKDEHGLQTANQSKFNMFAMTAAHKLLPLPSVVSVTNLSNGLKTIVIVNDRGPFVKGRIIDLTEMGADVLGFKEKGIERVKVELKPDHTIALLQLIYPQEKLSSHIRNVHIPDHIMQDVSLIVQNVCLSSNYAHNGDADHHYYENINYNDLNEQIFISIDYFLEEGESSEDTIDIFYKTLELEFLDDEIGDLMQWDYQNGYYRLLYGPLPNHKVAQSLLVDIKKFGYDGKIIVDYVKL